MKKTILLIGLVLGGFVMGNANAQLRVSLGININSQPAWIDAPVVNPASGTL